MRSTSISLNHPAEAASSQTEAAFAFPERFVLCQSIRQRVPGIATQNNRFGGVPRAQWYSAAARS
jgi:hypothetical protein